MRGFLTVEWQQLAAIPEGDNEKPNTARGDQIMRKIMRAMHNFSMAMWTERNLKLHGPESSGLRILRCPELLELFDLHSRPMLVNASDRHFCERPLEDLLRATYSVRRRRLQYMRNARARFEQDGRKQTVMTDFFRAH
jgi:hypothetical protein